MATARRLRGVLALFDVDGTLTMPRLEATEEMHEFLKQLRQHVVVGVVGGSDLPKMQEQLGNGMVDKFDYVFAENGLMAFQNGAMLGCQSLKTHMGEEKLKEFINYALHYIADIDIPFKRGKSKVVLTSEYCTMW